MLTCIACSKQVNNGSYAQQDDDDDDNSMNTPKTKNGIKGLRAQIKGMAIKASGSYKKSKLHSESLNQNHSKNYPESDAGSGSAKYYYSSDHHANYHLTMSSNSTPRIWSKELESRSHGSTPRVWSKEFESRSHGISSGEMTPVSVSGRTETLVFLEEDEPKEWVAQVEPGVLITFVSMPGGGNDLKRIRFSREMFNQWQAQRWWADNYDKVMELYNVQQLNQQAVPLPTPPRSDDESSRLESAKESPRTPPLSKESMSRNFHCSTKMAFSSSDSLDQHPLQSRHYYDSIGHASTPKLSSMSGAKTEASSVDGSARTSSWKETERYSGGASLSNASDMETEWVEQDEPGVYITIRALADGTRELRRVRFSREKFGETQAKLWWEENKARIQQQYL